jgi:transcriptional regulator with XRE-family HTH domain
MPRRALSAEDCQRLAGIIDTLDVTQKALAQSSGVGQPWLSYLIRGERITSVDVSKLQRLANRLVELTMRRREAKTLPEEQARVALDFLGRFASIPATPICRDIATPGGPISNLAVPYVEREHDSFLSRVFDRGNFDILVWGPAQSGKSTALAHLQRRAHQLGYETAWFDPQAALPGQQDKRNESDDTRAASELGELLQVKWGFERPRFGVIDGFDKLNMWLTEELIATATKPRLLILDDLSRIGRSVGGRWISRFVRHIANVRTSFHIRLSVAVGTGFRYATNFSTDLLVVSDHNWRSRLEPGWLDRDEVSAMLRSVADVNASDVSQDQAAALFAMFKGQPYLTHAAALDQKFYAAARSWSTDPSESTAASLYAHPWYRRHLVAIKFAMFGPTYKPEDADTRRLAETFVRAALPLPFASEYARKPQIDSEHLEFFTRAKLLNEQGLPTLKIYGLVALHLKSILDERST